jgi:hypothetical protein
MRVTARIGLFLAFVPLTEGWPQRGPAESWSIKPGRVTGADPRGLRYGMLEAPDQIRSSGRLRAASGQPATPMRGIRYLLHTHDLEEVWY